jgi:Nucleotidyltransferase of unknown function (DUF6036)
MPSERGVDELPSPWREFLSVLDESLSEPLELHCIGGFVLVYFYGYPRTTGDIDYCSAVPANLNLEEVAGQSSPLHKKYGVWLHRVAVANLPEEYQARLTEMVPGQFSHLKLLVPDPYDCILSKLERGSGKDRDDADYLFRSQKLDAKLLRERYEKELRHNLIGNVDWHDGTLKLWIEIFEAPR